MSRRHYVDNAPSPTFGPVGTTDTSWSLSAATGLPTSFPFNATLDIGTASQENVLVTNIVGSTVTVTRNIDGLGAFSHATGASFTHTALAIDYDEANAHVNASTGVHGISGAVVGTTDTQMLSNKTFAGVTFTADSGVVGITVTGDGTGDLMDLKDGASTVAKVDDAGHLTAASVTTAGASSVGSSAVTGNETVGGTLGVTGTSTLGVVAAGATTVSTLGTSGLATLASASVTGNETVGGTLGVTGASTLAAVSATTASTSGKATLNSAEITNNLTVDGTLILQSAPTIQVFSSSGTWTKPAGLVAARIRAVGSGGGSGGISGTSNQGASGPGGAGGYCEAYIVAASLGSTETVTVGAAGTAGASGNNAGGTGGNVTFGSHLTASGGAGGGGAATSAGTGSTAGGVGGAASGADVNIVGGAGSYATVISPGIALGTGYGGASQLGGATPINTGGTGYGSGAGGATASPGPTVGFAGGKGVCIVECFFS